jgi:hypothetical protein
MPHSRAANAGTGLEPRYTQEAESPPPSKDPWEHRAKNMRCDSCMWFALKSVSRHETIPVLGRCRRRAPTLNGYPAVYLSDWCGDHKMDEAKA